MSVATGSSDSRPSQRIPIDTQHATIPTPIDAVPPMETTATPPPVASAVDTAPPEARRPSRFDVFFAPFRTKPVQALGWFLLIAAIPYAHPKLKKFRLIHAPWDHDVEITNDGPTGITPEYGDVVLEQSNDETPTDEQHAPIEVQVAPAASAPDPKIPLIDVAKEVGAAYRPIEDPTGHALDSFYAALAKTESGAPNSAVRVAHYGDSLIVSDFMSSTLRRRFQARFGDAGHGFVLTAKAWKWYLHYDVQFSSSEGWVVNRIVNPRIADELYGYGGVSFRASDAGVKATFSTSKPVAGIPDEGFGRRVSKWQVHWLAQPGGGKFDVSIDGSKVQTIDTKSPEKKLETTWFTADDGEHSFEVKVAGGGESRIFGVAMERDVPGVVWDALGVLGGRARILDVNDTKHWSDAMRARDPALVVFQYGTNESTDTGYPMDQYESSLEQVLRHAKQAVPNASCLVVGPMDRGIKGGGGETMPIIKQLEEAQRKVALKVGCAYWDTFLAMGGDGAMARWVKAKPQLGSGDFTHPTYAGASILGDLLYSALMSGFVSSAEYAKTHAAPPP